MSKYLKAAARVLIVLLAAGAIGLSLFAAMQLVVHPLLGAPRRQQFTQNQRAFGSGDENGARRPEGGEGRAPGRIRLRTLAGLVGRVMLFGAASVFVIVVQKLFFRKRPRFMGRS